MVSETVRLDYDGSFPPPIQEAKIRRFFSEKDSPPPGSEEGYDWRGRTKADFSGFFRAHQKVGWGG